MSKLKVALITTLLTASFACSKQSAPTTADSKNPPRNSVDVVKAVAQPVEISRNGTAEAVVNVTIQPGYHVNANPPTFTYLKATELELATVPGVSVSFIVYPNALTKSFPFAEKPLAVYEGETSIKVNLTADKLVPQGNQSLAGKLRVQACDDHVCYAPGTLDVSIPLSIK